MEMLTAAEAAQRLGMEVHFVYREIKAGRLPAKKYGAHWRIRVEDFEEYTTPAPIERTPRNRRDRLRQLLKKVPA